MLPTAFEKYIPKFFTRDSKLTAFADKIDEIIESLKSDTIGLNDLIDPVKCPAILLDKLGYFLNANIKEQDTERQKRIKIATAVEGHKKRGSFEFDAKPKIDAIAGGDSSIITEIGGDDWILVGDGLTPSAYYWATLGADGIDTDYGLALIGGGDEIEIAGNIYIDVDNSSLTASEQEQIELEMEDIVPAYYKVFFGYISAGLFVLYFIME